MTNTRNLYAGASKVNITPGIGTIINGDFLPMYAKAIHDSLYSKALAFQYGETKFVFVVVDNTGIDPEMDVHIKSLLNKTLDLSPHQVMLSVTHAHSCGSLSSFGASPADFNYRLALPEKIVESVKLALDNLQPAKIAWGNFDEPKHVSCRRWYMKKGFSMFSPFGKQDKVWMNPPLGSPYLDRPASPTDTQVSFLAVKSFNDEWISILANYSTHYAADVPPNTISADYFGEVDKNLKKGLSADDSFVGIVSNGTSGDVNTFDFKLEKNYPTEPMGKTKLIGSDIANGILKTLNSVVWDNSAILNYSFTSLKLTARAINSYELEEAKKSVINTNFNELNSIDKASDSIKKLYALELVRLNEYKKDFYNAPLQAIRIGKGIIGTLPGEFFSETGLALKKNAQTDNYFSICLANGGFGYVPPKEQHDLGGYETWQCVSSFLEFEAEEKIRTKLITLINSLK
jgi:neutral ceramidase